MKKKKSLLKRTYRTHKQGRTLKPILLGVFAFSTIVYFVVSRLPKAVPIAINEVAVSPATVTLTLPSSVSATPGTTATANLTVNTGGAQVSAVQVELSYDPTSIETPTLIQGDFLTNKLGNPKIQNGLISFVYVVPVGAEGKSGAGVLATLKFKAKKGDSQITFTKNTMVAALGSATNMLQSATGTNIILSSSTINDQPSTISTTPPILTDIQPAPGAANPRTFDETGNFDYSKTVPVAPDTTTTSPFARFIAMIKAFFGAK
ncbi:MAG: hypothetical protein UX21_C0040G0005 [Microgenomates group bacterium GW2011_GWC2_45_8]|nr:MAG: hypothetical protein UX21_C0040G0005 [Microgenomates group bacterium GW2011_GWC2_45_8]